MASKEQEEEKYSNTKTGEETLALEKKRSKSRRVSFAETTAVHLFLRDEEYETPPEVGGSSNGRLNRTESDEIRELLASDDDDSDNGVDVNDDDGGNVVKRSFLRPFESPSSGSYVGSATSNDEDNFFGPVSADFIKPRRLSDSAASDENHDVTMDSTAFSMHFRSLAKSDSGGEFKTPIGGRLEFGEKTLGQVSTTTSGRDLMVLTASRKQTPDSSLPVDIVNGSGNSDDMIVVGENPRRYDYGELPPDLDMLLAEDGKDVGAVSQSSDSKDSKSFNSFEMDAGAGLHENRLKDLQLNNGIDDHHVSNMKRQQSDGAFSSVHANVDNKNDPVLHSTLAKTTHIASHLDDHLYPVTLSDDHSKMINVMPVDKDVEAGKAYVEVSRKVSSPLTSSQPQLNHEQPIAGSVTSLLAKQRHIVGISPNLKPNLFVAENVFSEKGSKHISSASSVQKRVSRLERLESVLLASASKAEGDASSLKSLESLTSSLTRNKLLKYASKDASPKYLAPPVVCLDAQFSEVSEDMEHAKRSTCDTEHSKIESQEMQYDELMLEKLDMASESSKLVLASANVDTGATLTTEFQVNNVELDAASVPTVEDIPDEVPIQLLETPKSQLVGTSVLIPRSRQLNSKDQPSMEPSSCDSSFNLKRKLYEKADDHYHEPASILRKSKLCKELEKDAALPHNIGRDASKRDWVDVFTSFCGVSKLLPSLLIDKLKLAQIRMLIDILVRVDKMRSYELLRHARSQKSSDSTRVLQTRRLIDTKSLLNKIAYQKVKLQLIHLERDKLLDQVHQLDDRVEESRLLRASCHGSCIYGQMIARKDCFSSANPSKMSLVAAETSSLREALDVLDREIRKLEKSFDPYIKNMKEPTCTEPTVHVKNYLRQRDACQSVQSEFQLCHVESIKAVDGEPNLLLDHVGIMSQSFIVKPISTYSLFISNSLNNAKISKMFPGIKNAFIPFSFALCGESVLAYYGFQSIARKLQETTSLLHTVVDVVEEVKLAMLELRNLTDASFSQPSAGKLDLQLWFTDFNFNCGARVALSIDVTCLNRGIYPSHVLPYEVQGRVAGGHESFQSLLDKIKNDIHGVRYGYMRISSLCRRVSRTIQDFKLIV